jgi:hypothetical protein
VFILCPLDRGRDMDSIYGKNKDYLSYSAIDAWYKNKESYIKRYFNGVKTKDTCYTAFGRIVHDKIAKDTSLSHIPRLGQFEACLRGEIQGVNLLSYLDTFDPTTCQFYEYKTGIAKADGKPRWTEEDVIAHKQLPFYAMMIKSLHGFYNPDTLLIFLETIKNNKKEEKKLCSITWNKEMELTGKYTIFNRKITDKEVEEITNWTLIAAEEIKKEYANWLKI